MIDIARAITIEIPGRPPSLNARRHWRVVAEDNAEWAATAKLLSLAAVNEWAGRHGLKWRTFRRCTLAVEFVVAYDRPRDWDNLSSTLKPLLDGIVDARVIADDSTRVIAQFTLDVVIEPGVTATRFTIAELPE